MLYRICWASAGELAFVVVIVSGHVSSAQIVNGNQCAGNGQEHHDDAENDCADDCCGEAGSVSGDSRGCRW